MIAPEKVIADIRMKYGSTITDILTKESEFDLYEILGAIQTLVGSKIAHQLPTSPAERMVFAFSWLAAEVQNGGFHQYFANSAGDFWKEVLHGLEELDDKPGLALFKEALSIFPNSSPSTDRDTRLDQLEQLEEIDEDTMWNHFTQVTNRYFKASFPDWKVLYDYVKSHTDEFDLREG